MKNGLYSIHVSLQDGRVGKGSGVIIFRDGKIVGGDAYLFYTGTYTVKDGTFKGEVLVQRHTTPRDNDSPLFGGPAPVEHLQCTLLDYLPRCHQDRRVQVALQRLARLDPADGLIQRHSPVDTDHVRSRFAH